MSPVITSTSLWFQLGMWWRIIYGVFRIFLGITFLKLVGQPFAELIYHLMAHEITGKRGDAILEMLYNALSIHDMTVTYFIASYFLFWGTVDIILCLCLLWHVRAAFPIAMGLIVLFICYGTYRFTHTHSLILLGVLILDVIILYLVHQEYRGLMKKPDQVATT